VSSDNEIKSEAPDNPFFRRISLSFLAALIALSSGIPKVGSESKYN